MRSCKARRLAVGLALALGLLPALVSRGGQAPAAAKGQVFAGKVVPLAGVLEKSGVKLDPEAEPEWLALVADDGKVYPLIRDDGSRMFFKDKRLLNRPMRLTGQLFADTHLLQVVSVHSIRSGKLHEVYYWCDICSIRRFEPGKCDCCGGPMELREVPVK
jgi:hypothetical protein